MYHYYPISWSLFWLCSLHSRKSYAQVSPAPTTTAVEASPTASPTCLQPRAPTNPLAAAIQSSVASDNAVNKACDPSTQNIGTLPWAHTFYTPTDYYFLNTSLQDLPRVSIPTNTPSSYPANQGCIQNLNAVFSSCVINQNFWGGWIESNGVNYSSKYFTHHCLHAAINAIL